VLKETLEDDPPINWHIPPDGLEQEELLEAASRVHESFLTSVARILSWFELVPNPIEQIYNILVSNEAQK